MTDLTEDEKKRFQGHFEGILKSYMDMIIAVDGGESHRLHSYYFLNNVVDIIESDLPLFRKLFRPISGPFKRLLRVGEECIKDQVEDCIATRVKKRRREE